jgi:hypothetical protein
MEEERSEPGQAGTQRETKHGQGRVCSGPSVILGDHGQRGLPQAESAPPRGGRQGRQGKPGQHLAHREPAGIKNLGADVSSAAIATTTVKLGLLATMPATAKWTGARRGRQTSTEHMNTNSSASSARCTAGFWQGPEQGRFMI